MNDYFGITIGPIISTLSIARKPRELWSASYLFSLLMETLIEEAVKLKIEILSPAQETSCKSVGLFPDRLFCKMKEGVSIETLVKNAKLEYTIKAGIPTDYFNIWITEISAPSDGEAVKNLNTQLNFLELQNVALKEEEEATVKELIAKQSVSLLFQRAFDSPYFRVGTLAEISTAQLKQIADQENNNRYQICLQHAKKYEKTEDEDIFIQLIKENFSNEFKTPHKYICIVHADGDNIGTIINTLPGEQIKELSQRLIDFGGQASEKIKLFGGLPIYAGGDDLLFIAPIISNDSNEKEQNIFDLIDELDQLFKDHKINEFKGKNEEGKALTPGMSYGLSITYHKYPLYEALTLSRDLLFKIAKKTEKKNAIAWTLQKGSGTSISGSFSKSNDPLKKAFYNLINSIDSYTLDGNLISAAAHKIKASEYLLKLFMGSKEEKDRLNAFVVEQK